MKLYYAATSPYVRKVLVCAHELGIAASIEKVPMPVAPHTPNREYAATNPVMKIPALVRENGEPLFDSVVICEYLDTTARGSLFPRDGEARWHALRLHALGDAILDAALTARYESAVRPKELLWNDWLEGQYAKIDQCLDALEAQADALAREFRIGEITAACALGYLDFRFAHRPWRDGRPALAHWYGKVATRESMKATAPPA